MTKVDTCWKCQKNPISKVKLVMYLVNSKPVYYRLCDECMKKRWEDYKKESQDKLV